MMDLRTVPINVCSINEHLVCTICKGYLREAQTIPECLHSFCKSCIYHYFTIEYKRTCPKCGILLKPCPQTTLIPDQQIQNVTDTIFPEFPENDVHEEKAFYAKHTFLKKRVQSKEKNTRSLRSSQANARLSVQSSRRFSRRQDRDGSNVVSEFCLQVLPHPESDGSVDHLPRPYLYVPGSFTMYSLRSMICGQLNITKKNGESEIEVTCLEAYLGPELSVQFIHRTIWSHQHPDTATIILHYQCLIIIRPFRESDMFACDNAAILESQRKGLHNEIGANNCFLNVIIQSLWHIRSFRALITSGDHAMHHRQPRNPNHPQPNTCLLCELERIFVNYKFGEASVLQVNALRLALSDSFPIGDMNDATETLESIFDALHYDTSRRLAMLRSNSTNTAQTLLSDSALLSQASTLNCEPYCISHALFQMNLMELNACPHCHEMDEPIMNTDFLYRVYVQEILTDARNEHNFERVLRKRAQDIDDDRESNRHRGMCRQCKKASMQLSRWILTLPTVFAISIIWSVDSVKPKELDILLHLLSTRSRDEHGVKSQILDLKQIFHLGDVADSHPISSQYAFRGMVCYYGRHYVGFFASRTFEGEAHVERWFLFDDTRVKRVGRWEDVCERVKRGRYQPTLLFYERKDLNEQTLQEKAKVIHEWWQCTDSEIRHHVEAYNKSAKDTNGKMLNREKKEMRHRDSRTQLCSSPVQKPKTTMKWEEPLDLLLMQEAAEKTIGRLSDLLESSKADRESKDVWATSALKESIISTNVLRSSQRFCTPSIVLSANSLRLSTRKREYNVPHAANDRLDPLDRDAIFEE